VALVPDEGSIEQLPAAGPHPSFHDRVHAGHLDAAAYDRDTGVGQDRIELRGELAVPVTNQVSRRRSGFFEIHDEVAGGLGDPGGGWMGGGPEDVDAAAGVFDHREDVHAHPG